PLKSPQLAELKQKLRDKPADEPAKQEIRALDLRLRQHYFRHVWRMRSGVWMLLGAAALFGLATARLDDARKRPPPRRPEAEARLEAVRTAAQSRWAVAACGAALGAGLFVAGLAFQPTAPAAEPGQSPAVAADATAPAVAAGSPSPANDWATPEELRQNW